MTKKLSNKKGFTLAELLVVVAIIAVLVAVSIPIFTAQTKKANLATNQANARAAKAAAVSAVLGGDTATSFTYDITTGTILATADTTGTTSVDSKNLDPSTWTVTNQTALADKTYQHWTVVVKNETGAADNGTVTDYKYSVEKK